MSEFNDGLAMGLASGNNNANCMPYMYGNNGFGNGWGDGWWILLLLLCGWGNNGWGGNANNQFQGYEIGKLATQADVSAGFANSAVLNGLNDIKLGQQDGFASVQQSLCQGFSGVNATVNQVGNTINQGICNLGYTLANDFNQLGHQISDCCCQTQRAIDGVNYNMAKNTCDIQNTLCNATRDIIDSQRYGTDRILNFLNTQEMDRLRARVQTLETEKSFAQQNALNDARTTAQTAEILRRTGHDSPTAAYVVPNPNCCYDGIYGRNGYGWNSCDCGCGCC